MSRRINGDLDLDLDEAAVLDGSDIEARYLGEVACAGVAVLVLPAVLQMLPRGR